jgi:hypothetical protein
MTAGKPLAAGASTYAAMKLLRRNKLKDEERKNMEKKSELTDDKIIAATESAKREAKDVMLAASLAGAVAPMIAHQVAKRHGTDLYHLSENKQAAKKAIRGVQAVMLAPLVLRKKGIKQYYLEKLEEQKRENKKK